MNKTNTVILLSVVALFLVTAGIVFVQKPAIEQEAKVEEPITLGYCPTMSGIAKEIASKNNNVSLKAYEFTSQALQSLNNGEINVVLVGRLAKENEIEDAFKKTLREGLTLVGKEKRAISLAELHHNRIHTYVSEELARKYVPETTEIIFHDSKELAIKEGINELILIQWSDFQENLELVIPLDEKQNKIEKFRIPVLYSYNIEHIKKLQV